MTHSIQPMKIYSKNDELPNSNASKFDQVWDTLKNRQQCIKSGEKKFSGGFDGIRKELAELCVKKEPQEFKILVENNDYCINDPNIHIQLGQTNLESSEADSILQSFSFWNKLDRFAILITGGAALGNAIALLPGAILGGIVGATYGWYISRVNLKSE